MWSGAGCAVQEGCFELQGAGFALRDRSSVLQEGRFELREPHFGLAAVHLTLRTSQYRVRIQDAEPPVTLRCGQPTLVIHAAHR